MKFKIWDDLVYLGTSPDKSQCAIPADFWKSCQLPHLVLRSLPLVNCFSISKKQFSNYPWPFSCQYLSKSCMCAKLGTHSGTRIAVIWAASEDAGLLASSIFTIVIRNTGICLIGSQVSLGRILTPDGWWSHERERERERKTLFFPLSSCCCKNESLLFQPPVWLCTWHVRWKHGLQIPGSNSSSTIVLFPRYKWQRAVLWN